MPHGVPIWFKRYHPAARLFRKVNRGGIVETVRLVPDAVRQISLKRGAKPGLRDTLAEPISPLGPRIGFVTTSYRNRARRRDIKRAHWHGLHS
jgi:hypothetical protein